MPNPWTLFKQLLPDDRKWVGQVVSTDSDTGKITVSVPEETGNNIVVEGAGTYTDGDYVFIKGGVITGKAPDLRSIISEEVS